MDPIVELLQALAPAVPREMTVVVLCDRGLASPKLWKQILAQGWHPYRRYLKNVTCCAEGGPAAAGACLRSTSGYRVDRERNCFRQSRRKTPLHPAGGLVRGTGGAVDHPDRPSAGGSWGELVCAPLLDRVGVQGLPPATTGGRSRAWVGNGRKLVELTRRGFRAIGSCCRWRRS